MQEFVCESVSRSSVSHGSPDALICIHKNFDALKKQQQQKQNKKYWVIFLTYSLNNLQKRRCIVAVEQLDRLRSRSAPLAPRIASQDRLWTRT